MVVILAKPLCCSNPSNVYDYRKFDNMLLKVSFTGTEPRDHGMTSRCVRPPTVKIHLVASDVVVRRFRRGIPAGVHGVDEDECGRDDRVA